MDSRPLRSRAVHRVVSLIVLILLAVSAQAADRPHVVFVLADDLGPGDLGCYGGTLAPTPRCDLSHGAAYQTEQDDKHGPHDDSRDWTLRILFSRGPFEPPFKEPINLL